MLSKFDFGPEGELDLEKIYGGRFFPLKHRPTLGNIPLQLTAGGYSAPVSMPLPSWFKQRGVKPHRCTYCRAKEELTLTGGRVIRKGDFVLFELIDGIGWVPRYHLGEIPAPEHQGGRQ